MRSAIVLRVISDVPPAIVIALLPMYVRISFWLARRRRPVRQLDAQFG